jgi:hypothetical protein
VNINYKTFDASGWKVQASGLDGDVRLVPCGKNGFTQGRIRQRGKKEFHTQRREESKTKTRKKAKKKRISRKDAEESKEKKGLQIPLLLTYPLPLCVKSWKVQTSGLVGDIRLIPL